MIKVFIKKIDSLTNKEIENTISTLSENAKNRLDKKKNEALRFASLCALSLLTDDQREDIAYTESGIPYFKSIDVHISISHSNSYAAVAISDSDIGIDIEDMSNQINSYRLNRFFTVNEKKGIENGACPIEIWTKKEALFKHLKNDDINFISLDTTQTNTHFKTISLDKALLTVCHKSEEEIVIQKL